MESMTSWEQEAAERIALNALRMGMTVEVTEERTQNTELSSQNNKR